MHEIVTADIGGTNARFAIATLDGARVAALGEPVTLKTAEHASLRTAWAEFTRRLGRPVPGGAAIAVAAPVGGELIKLTNNPWILRPAALAGELGVERVMLINDFGAVAHAVAQLGQEGFRTVCGPDRPLPASGAISIVGPGTGLGVSLLLRAEGRYQVVETEGGHVDFAPLDEIEDRILAHLRERHRRVSVERIVSGPGLANIYEALAAIEGRAVRTGDDAALWASALSGEDGLAAAALDRLCLSLGAVAGDIALAHGAAGVVIAGGVGLRLADRLPQSGFRDRFIAKGRWERRMDALPVKLVTHPQPGLWGAAAAFAQSLAG